MAGIELAPGADDNGLATMLAMMMQQNLADHPDREAALARMKGRIAIIAEDADVSVTIEVRKGRAIFHDGVVGIPDLTIRGGFEQIGDMSRMESLGPLPDPRGPVNKAMFAALREGRLRLYGLPRALPMLLRFGEVMAIH